MSLLLTGNKTQERPCYLWNVLGKVGLCVVMNLPSPRPCVLLGPPQSAPGTTGLPPSAIHLGSQNWGVRLTIHRSTPGAPYLGGCRAPPEGARFPTFPIQVGVEVWELPRRAVASGPSWPQASSDFSILPLPRAGWAPAFPSGPSGTFIL